MNLGNVKVKPLKPIIISLAGLFLLSLNLGLLARLSAAPMQPETVTISGDTNQPTVSWDSVDPEPNGVDWTEEVSAAGFAGRTSHTSVVLDDKMWVIGGFSPDGGLNRLNDVWYSSDGVNWTEATNSAGWTERNGHASVVFDNKMWVIGGRDGSSDCNGSGTTRCSDVWHSSDGVNWTEATNSAGWTPRNNHTSIVFDDKMWVIGGFDGSSDCNGSGLPFCSDVWHSSDGVNWTEATNSAGWPEREGHASAVFDNKMWVIGGLNDKIHLNDVWHSSDGVNWTEATSDAGWITRTGHASAVFSNNLWIMGGTGNFIDCNGSGTSRCSDVWYSSDGVNWTEATSDAGWTDRSDHASAMFDNKMWVIGGQTSASECNGANYCNDAWSTPDNAISHYLVCWDQTKGGCSNSAKVNPDGDVIAANSNDKSWLAQVRDYFFPKVNAQSETLSYTLQQPISSGTWHFQVAAFTVSDSQSPFTAASLSTEDLPGLPNTGMSFVNLNVNLIYIVFSFALIGLSIASVLILLKNSKLV